METQQKSHPVLLFFLYTIVTLEALFLTNNPIWGIAFVIFALPILIPVYIAFGKAFAKAKLFLSKEWITLVLQIVLMLFAAFIGALSTRNTGSDWRSDAPYIICIDGCSSYYSFWDVFVRYLISTSILMVVYHIPFYISHFKALNKEEKIEKEAALAAEIEKVKLAEKEAAEEKALEDILKDAQTKQKDDR
ncbi:hypothetical protein IJ768_01825 [Candidatus Saccharibacteria bacterium]|nr:hypothetical protein [Candidatus Saccharibacteria bacterium]